MAWAALILGSLIALTIGFEHTQRITLPVTAEAKLGQMPLCKSVPIIDFAVNVDSHVICKNGLLLVERQIALERRDARFASPEAIMHLLGLLTQ
jgi:hypothetical protein